MLSRNKQIEATECQHQLNTLLTLSPHLKNKTNFLTEGFIYFAGKSSKKSVGPMGLKKSRLQTEEFVTFILYTKLSELQENKSHLESRGKWSVTLDENEELRLWFRWPARYQLLLKHVIKESRFDHWLVLYWLQTRDIFIRIPPLITWHRGTQFSEYRGILTDKRQLFLQKNISDIYFQKKKSLTTFSLIKNI